MRRQGGRQHQARVGHQVLHRTRVDELAVAVKARGVSSVDDYRRLYDLEG
jgi:hypothetical protein